ncbi:2-iminoacetate synthase ThiH [Porphyromonas circumdentaria]|uniref:Tyrosine lyase ThiH n=1 Tax=Porphyromonas circumdentaria TaxID=29524 RepID=A0A1T4LH67_9PORP|nr:2-iminoacetate synthase ThiH [Porphyromonas circumdentaria]MBB6275259.1 2-iminoacetate synthase [Porphyromonas circumdentaria]SJZ53948.1 tyrosine lyase ThiH [Porphyromonas circumdentaria]
MTTFYDELRKLNWEAEEESIFKKTTLDVQRALQKDRCNLEDFKAFISPAAEPFLREMAIKAEQLTIKRYGRTIQMYVPLYVSNYCTNSCVYCGFSCHNQIHRVKLDIPQILEEIAVLKKWGFRHLLLVSGESAKLTDASYYEEVINAVRPHFAQISLEVQPLTTDEYRRMYNAGISYVCVYQETYNEKKYPEFHPRGEKANFRYRLETPDRCGTAGIQKIGIGALLGLQNWRTDSFFTALHLNYLERTHWKTKYSISLPRLRPHVGDFTPEDPINDKQMAQLICAYRLFDPEVDISLSTRESSAFRDMAMRIGATTMSAASSTEPGGYATKHEELEQFEINDARTVEEMAEAIRANGYEPVWKDWDEWL